MRGNSKQKAFVVDITDLEILETGLAQLRGGRDVFMAVIGAVHGSGPRPPGSIMLYVRGGAVLGSLSGGCVEDELLAQIDRRDFDDAVAPVLEYGLTAQENERLGLPCGGFLRVVLRPLRLAVDEAWLGELIELLARRASVTVEVSLATGAVTLREVARTNPATLTDAALEFALGPCERLLLVGAGHLSRVLARFALELDYEVFVTDPRAELLAEWHDQEGIRLREGMPDDVVRELLCEGQLHVVTLTHDPRIDDMALMYALESDAAYIGALGSVRTQAARMERLRALGLEDHALARLHAPIGLDTGSKTPAEIAVSILAELIQYRRRGSTRRIAATEPAAAR